MQLHISSARIRPGTRRIQRMGCDWLLIDGSSLIFRAYHGVPESVRAPDGSAVNAVRGFLDILARLVVQRRPSRLAVAEDWDWRPGWRVALLPTYKAHRTAEPVPPGLIPQLPVIHRVLEAVGVDQAGWPDHEAEDLISTWTTLAPSSVEVVSGDRDLFALVEDPRVRVLYPEKAGLTVVDEAFVSRRYGIPGRLYADFAVLRGDPSDGLPGLRGVGPATAARLLQIHGGIDGVLRSGGLSEADRDYLERAIQVVRPVRDLPLTLPPGRRDTYPADPPTVVRLTAEHGLDGPVGRLVGALTAMAGGSPTAAPPGAGREGSSGP